MSKFADAIRGLLGLDTPAAREVRLIAPDDRSREASVEHTQEKSDRLKTPLEIDDKLANALDLAHDEMIEDAWEWWRTQGETEELETYEQYERQAAAGQPSFADSVRDALSDPQEPEQRSERESDEIER